MRAALSRLRNHPFVGLLTHSRNYLIGTVSVKAMAFIALPILTRILSPADYGVYSVFASYVQILLIMLTLYCYTALGRYYYEKQDDLAEFFGSSLVFTFLLLAGYGLIFWLFRSHITGLLKIPAVTVGFLVPLVFFSMSASWYDQLYIPQKKSRQIAVRNVVQAFLTLGLSIIFILLLKENKFLGQIYASAMVGALFTAYYYFELRPYFRFSLRRRHIAYMLKFSVPLIPYVLSSYILAQFDRIMINNRLGSSSAGLYSFAYNIGMILTFVTSSIHWAWMPDYYRYMDEKAYGKMRGDASKIFKIICLAALALIYFGKEIGMAVSGKAFHSALGVVPIIIVGYIFNAIFAFYGWNIAYEKRNIYLSLSVLLAGVVNIILNYVFIPIYGFVAAAYATAFSYLLMALLVWAVSRFILGIYTLPLKVSFRPLAVLAPFIALYFAIEARALALPAAMILKAALMALCAYCLFKRAVDGLFKNQKIDPAV